MDKEQPSQSSSHWCSYCCAGFYVQPLISEPLIWDFSSKVSGAGGHIAIKPAFRAGSSDRVSRSKSDRLLNTQLSPGRSLSGPKQILPMCVNATLRRQNRLSLRPQNLEKRTHTKRYKVCIRFVYSKHRLQCRKRLTSEIEQQLFARNAGFCVKDLNRISNAAQRRVICCLSQRRVVVLGRIGGSEDLSCKHQTYLPFASCAQLGIRDASLVKNGR